MQKQLINILIALAAFAAYSPAMADVKLATDKKCLACHAVDKKIIGPGYNDVAAKYAGQKDAVEKLAGKIQKGSATVWGPIPMPANPQVSAAEAKVLATWIMTLK